MIGFLSGPRAVPPRGVFMLTSLAERHYKPKNTVEVFMKISGHGGSHYNTVRDYISYAIK
jgi:hypothetical protein